jgi:hypothetical protein
LTDLCKMKIYTTHISEQNFHLNPEAEESETMKDVWNESGVEDPYRTCTGTHQ